ncbi:MAG: Sapep family Mn(2+)-dependent dipeptidase, partial [Lachnospiraceae bacterium]|nr:Sapep family Mn(2+)-dependent dipeptidase [Lachnospiraceae bacterium]
MDYKKQIKQYFDDQWFEMMRDIARMVSINSERTRAKEGMPYGEGPYQALMEFVELAKEHGFEGKTYDNVVAAFDLNDKEKQLDMLAHLDVVPAGEGWTVTDPFEVKLKEGRIYGRGTADDKGPAVVALWALKCVRDLGIPMKKNARLIVGTDEECGSSDLPHYYAVEKEAPMTFSPDAEYPVINIEKGSYGPEFTAHWAEDPALPRVTSMKGSLKRNVLPGKAYAVVEGLTADEIRPIC